MSYGSQGHASSHRRDGEASKHLGQWLFIFAVLSIIHPLFLCVSRLVPVSPSPTKPICASWRGWFLILHMKPTQIRMEILVRFLHFCEENCTLSWVRGMIEKQFQGKENCEKPLRDPKGVSQSDWRTDPGFHCGPRPWVGSGRWESRDSSLLRAHPWNHPHR